MSKIKLEPGPYIFPMPLALVGAQVDGKPNFMPAAFLGIVNFNPPMVACGLNPSHHTCSGITVNGTFSLNIPGPQLVEATDWCGLKSGKKQDKSQVFETFYGELERAPMIKDCVLTAECKLIQKVEFEVDTVFFGEIVSVYADQEAVHNGGPDWRKISPLLFTFPDKSYWQLGQYIAQAWSVGKNFAP